MNVRPAAVAGLFYPADEASLAATVDRCLEGEPVPPGPLMPCGVIAPHAGYRYSGTVAGTAFRALRERADTRRAVVIGPSHHVAFAGIATSPADRFETPLGGVEVARGLSAELERLPGVAPVREVHAPEHAIEVELPFLQRLLGEFDLVPLVVGQADAPTVGRVLATALDRSPCLLVVSSDLSHYLTSPRARRADARTAARIEARAVDLEPEAACGAAAINGLSALARDRVWRIDRLELCNSGDVTGDVERVVGYGAFVFGPSGRPSGDPSRESSGDVVS